MIFILQPSFSILRLSLWICGGQISSDPLPSFWDLFVTSRILNGLDLSVLKYHANRMFMELSDVLYKNLSLMGITIIQFSLVFIAVV